MLTVVLDRPGDRPLELTPIAESCSWDSAAVGGFGSCSFTITGLRPRRDVPYLATVRLYYGTLQLWEGRVEDITFNVVDGQTTVKAFGLRRLLDFTSVHRVWSLRDLDWKAVTAWSGAVGDGSHTLSYQPAWTLQSGQFDTTDLTKVGIKVSGYTGSNSAGSLGQGNGMYVRAPSGITFLRVLCLYDASNSGGGATGYHIGSSSDGVTWTADAGAFLGSALSGQALSAALASGTYVRVGMWNADTAHSTTTSDYAIFRDVRMLGTSLVEDATGGFYGSTILRDLIGLIPGLAVGTIEDGNDFTIESIERRVRDAAASVVDEVAGFYAREWAVWENGRFDWITPNLDEPQFVFRIPDCVELELTGSLDALVGTSYVLYSDAATGNDAEASSAATSQRNPFVRTGSAKDDLTSVGFPMTANTSAQLAARIAAERGLYPPVTGRVVLPANAQVKDDTGTSVPAFSIRAGRNVYIPDLPRDEILNRGRDGQTLFHVVTCEADMGAGTVTLELEGQGRQLEVIQARLAAATKVLTG